MWFNSPGLLKFKPNSENNRKWIDLIIDRDKRKKKFQPHKEYGHEYIDHISK